METRQTSYSVTAENYEELGNQFIRANGAKLISLADGKSQGVEHEATIKQWGAWRAYFKERKIKTAFMDHQGKTGKCWTVPALWPHEFDSEATVQGDYRVGEIFAKFYRPERVDMAEAAKRLMTVRKFREAKKAQEPTGPVESEKNKPLDAEDFHSSEDLRAPNAPASDALLNLLENQGYEFPEPATQAA